MLSIVYEQRERPAAAVRVEDHVVPVPYDPFHRNSGTKLHHAPQSRSGHCCNRYQYYLASFFPSVTMLTGTIQVNVARI